MRGGFPQLSSHWSHNQVVFVLVYDIYSPTIFGCSEGARPCQTCKASKRQETLCALLFSDLLPANERSSPSPSDPCAPGSLFPPTRRFLIPWTVHVYFDEQVPCLPSVSTCLAPPTQIVHHRTPERQTKLNAETFSSKVDDLPSRRLLLFTPSRDIIYIRYHMQTSRHAQTMRMPKRFSTSRRGFCHQCTIRCIKSLFRHHSRTVKGGIPSDILSRRAGKTDDLVL